MSKGFDPKVKSKIIVITGLDNYNFYKSVFLIEFKYENDRYSGKKYFE